MAGRGFKLSAVKYLPVLFLCLLLLSTLTLFFHVGSEESQIIPETLREVHFTGVSLRHSDLAQPPEHMGLGVKPERAGDSFKAQRPQTVNDPLPVIGSLRGQARSEAMQKCWPSGVNKGGVNAAVYSSAGPFTSVSSPLHYLQIDVSSVTALADKLDILGRGMYLSAKFKLTLMHSTFDQAGTYGTRQDMETFYRDIAELFSGRGLGVPSINELQPNVKKVYISPTTDYSCEPGVQPLSVVDVESRIRDGLGTLDARTKSMVFVVCGSTGEPLEGGVPRSLVVQWFRSAISASQIRPVFMSDRADKLLVAVHVRRGEVMLHQRFRQVSSETYVTQLAAVLDTVAHEGGAEVHVFSETYPGTECQLSNKLCDQNGKAMDFEAELQRALSDTGTPMPAVTVHLDHNPAVVFSSLVLADILFTSNSGFSGWAGTISSGVVVSPMQGTSQGVSLSMASEGVDVIRLPAGTFDQVSSSREMAALACAMRLYRSKLCTRVEHRQDMRFKVLGRYFN
jgi:hypothetical protein